MKETLKVLYSRVRKNIGLFTVNALQIKNIKLHRDFDVSCHVRATWIIFAGPCNLREEPRNIIQIWQTMHTKKVRTTMRNCGTIMKNWKNTNPIGNNCGICVASLHQIPCRPTTMAHERLNPRAWNPHEDQHERRPTSTVICYPAVSSALPKKRTYSGRTWQHHAKLK